MCDIPTMIERLFRLKEELIPLAGESMTEEQSGIVGLNKEQMLSGIAADNNGIGEYHNIGYALEKEKQNPRAGYGNVDLKLTGEFQEQMYLIVSGDEYEISSQDNKTNKLVEKYGENIFGLTADNQELAGEIIYPVLRERVLLLLDVEY